MWKLKGKTLRVGSPFVDGDVQYPADWLQHADDIEKARLGVQWYPDPVRPNDMFYEVAETEDGVFTATPKDLAVVQKQVKRMRRRQAKEMLALTDWYVAREVEDPTKPIPNWAKNFRRNIRQASNQFDNAVDAAVDVPSLEAINQAHEWPEIPAQLED